MSFRTLEITNPTEIHIKNNQLELTQENRQIYIPIEDLSMITTIGSNIRLSTMDLSILANMHIADYVGRLCGAKRPRCVASGHSF